MANAENDRQPKSGWDNFVSVSREIWHFGGPKQSERSKRLMARIGVIILAVLLVSAFLRDAAAGLV